MLDIHENGCTDISHSSNVHVRGYSKMDYTNLLHNRTISMKYQYDLNAKPRRYPQLVTNTEYQRLNFTEIEHRKSFEIHENKRISSEMISDPLHNVSTRLHHGG